MSLIALLFLLIVFCVVVWAVRALLAAFAIPDPLYTIIWVAVVLVAIAVLWGQFVGLGSGPVIRLH